MTDFFKRTRESMKRTFDQISRSLDETFSGMDADMRDVEEEIERDLQAAGPGAEKVITVEETKVGGVVTKVVTRTVIRRRV